MLKIHALNRESSSDEDVPVIRREAQEAIALEQYNNALRLQSSGNLSEAEQILLNLINENIPQLENNGGLPSSMSTLKYSCFMNIGNVYLKKGENDSALDHYISASELDATDVTLWYKIGTLAIKQNRFRQAAYAFTQGLECSESHWPSLDQLISLLYAMRDTISCLFYIGKALNLDPDYLKGLVLRKQIYKDNPATIQYYQKYNPDYIYEPSLEINIEEEDQLEILKTEQILYNKISEAEKAVGPTALQTIPLPKALDDYTWISFGRVVIDLHQYITDNHMSHFTMVDMSKCMSQVVKEVEMVEPENIEVKEPIPEETVVEKVAEPELEEEKMEVDPVSERRPSQSSENNNDGQENTPIQTDNDEEQVMEQDGDDADDNNDSKTDKRASLNKSNKRKRDLLSDLQIWGWHSKRKSTKKGKTDKDFSVEDALNRIIPKNLLRSKIAEEKLNQLDDSMNTIDIYNMYVEEDRNYNILSPIHSPKSVTSSCEYFNTEREKEEILSIWTKEREYCDAIVLIKDFIMNLSKLWHLQWPKELVLMYIEGYNMYREHYDHPDVFSTHSAFTEIREDALVTLLYGELLNFSTLKSETRVVHITSLASLQVVSGWQEEWKDEFVNIFTRVYWLRAHIFRKEGNNDLAIRALELIQEVLQEEELKTGNKYTLILPNCFKCGVINNEIASKILKRLDMITSLNCLEELYNAEKYKEVADILKLTFKGNSNHPTCGKMGRPAQLAVLLHSLWYTNLEECFIWTEECLWEALVQFLKPARDYEKWEMVVEKCLAFFHEIIKMETVRIVDCLSEDKRARLVETLSKIICKQLNCDGAPKIPLGCVTPWILLHYILVREEHRQHASKKTSHIKGDKNDPELDQSDPNEDLPASVAILISAHEFLGPKGWCLTSNGELLHFILDTVLDRLDTPIFEALREKIDIHIEQSLFCLYQHPSKKNKISRHLADHNVDPLPLTWERAFQLYDFYGPDSLPEFNSYKNASISADLEQLLQRIIALVPSEMDPQPHTTKFAEFIQGKTTQLPDAIEFSNKMRAIYYLIGDYYFKQREFHRCLKYFIMDLCINPTRLDTWACIALSHLSQLENKLNYCKKMKNETEFLDKAKCAEISFQKALDLEKDTIVLWIEFGTFEYMVHSFCSRVMKSESDTLSMEKFEYLENQKNYYLESSGRIFEKTIQVYQPDDAEADERWLQYYVLGKVAEKQQKEPNDYLQHYIAASKLLHENNAMYPDKINYYNPQHLSVEALELHYRMNASILKYLELHDGKDIPNSVGNLFKEYLDNSHFPKKTLVKASLVPQIPAPVPQPAIEKPSEDIEKEVKTCLSEMLTKVEDLLKEKKTADVIVLSDSEEETPKPSEVQVKNVQEMLDKMMEETMKKTEEQEPDSDTSINSKNITEVKVEEKKEVKAKSESETETDIRTSVDDSSSSDSSSSSSSSSSDSDDDTRSSTTTTSSSEASNGNMSSSETLALVDRCIIGLEQCVVRLPQNYKAIYRLAHLYYNYKAKKDLTKCKQLLLGEYTCKGGVVITGLFSDRKNNNLFHGIWRIPSSEIDRPGSLSAHMSRCITLLLQILRATNDYKILLDLPMQFRKTPDPDKIYIKDSERLQFADQAMAMCIQCLRSQIQNIPTLSDVAVHKLLQDVFRTYQRIQKNEPTKEAVFASMLIEVYKKMKKDKVPETGNMLDLATKFCQQNRIVEKQKRQTQVQPQAAVLRGPGLPTPPVLPAPSVASPANPPLLRRPGAGRPRGRPPLPKIPGQTRTPRGRSPNVAPAYPWQKSMFEQSSYNYLKQYQEELIKQYSQSFNLTQLTQLSQYLTQNQLASTLANPYMSAQNSLLNNANLLSQMTANQFMKDAPKSSYKKKAESAPLAHSSGLTVEPVNPYVMIGQSPKPAYNKKSLPHTITSAAQAATITKVKSTVPSSIYSMSALGNLAGSPGTKSKSMSKLDAAKLAMSKGIYSTAGYPGGLYVGGMNYSTADINKMSKKSGAVTKTTSSNQMFKEPALAKAHHKSADKAANILMKERPNISITPVMAGNMPHITTSAFIAPIQSTPAKTLQEKLADKQKQLLSKQTKQMGRNIESDILSIQAATLKKNLNIPSSLTVSKAIPYKFPVESGISISQIPVTQMYKTTESLNLKPKKKDIIVKTKKTTTGIHLPPHLPISTVRKKPDPKVTLPDDDVILID